MTRRALSRALYGGKARGSFWYNPVFKVQTLDGQEVWRRSDYRCKRGDTPGRGSHLFPFQLNLSSSVHRVTQFNSCMCPGAAQIEL